MRWMFSFSGTIDRKTYLKTGCALLALKVAVDCVLMRVMYGDWVWPYYLFGGPELAATPHSQAALWTVVAMIAWAVVFLWIGVAMTERRAVDAGLSPWWAALFVVPFVNYALMLALCFVPTRPRRVDPATLPAEGLQPMPAVIVGAAGVATAVGLVALCVFVLKNYAGTLFIGVPVIFGAACAYVANCRGRRTLGATLGITYLTLVAVAGALLLVAMEGAVCLLMAAPLAAGFATIGALLGYAAAAVRRNAAAAGPAALLLPALVALDALAPPPQEHEVASSVEIDAPPATVWRHVVGFSEIPDPPEGLFRAGLACPMRATIDGRGVGAVRRCEFTTGAFIEPITTWDEPRRLAFDVARQPPPLVELSPYSTVHAPHLDGYFRSVRGEFRLVALDGGRTRLEGSTW